MFSLDLMRLPVSLVLGAALVACAAQHSTVEREHWVVTYYDRDHDGRVDFELHQLPGTADSAWALSDTRFRGRYDLRIRYGKTTPMAAAASGTEARDAGSKGWLGAMILLGLAAAVALGLAWWAWIVRRRDRRSETSIDGVLSFPCSACGKTLKAKLELVGKKVKCSGCSAAVLIADSSR